MGFLCLFLLWFCFVSLFLKGDRHVVLDVLAVDVAGDVEESAPLPTAPPPADAPVGYKGDRHGYFATFVQ